MNAEEIRAEISRQVQMKVNSMRPAILKEFEEQLPAILRKRTPEMFGKTQEQIRAFFIKNII